MTKSCHKFQLSIALFLLLCALSLDCVVLSVRADSSAAPSSNRAGVSAKTDSVLSWEGLPQRVRDAVEKIRPSLVTIHGTSQKTSDRVFSPFLPEFSNGDFDLFKDQAQFPSIFPADSDRSGVATGVIVSEDGFIWTSSDMVRGLDSVTVTMQDNRSYDGKVIFSDPVSGLGIVKIDAQELPAVQLEETVKFQPADWAIAVALDDNHEPNLAAGMISSFKRPKSESELGMIRCSFPVAAEFARCAIVNLDGELMGINVANPPTRRDSFSVCHALDAGSAKELHQKAVKITTVSHGKAIPQGVASLAAATPCESTQNRKEGTRSQIERISRLLSGPGSKWTSDSITSSVRNWLGSWLDAAGPLPHSVSNASEPR